MPLVSYNIDFPKLIQQLLGGIHRKSVRVAWLKAILKPLEQIHNRWLEFSNAKWEEMKYNGQTFILEQMLIARFGAGITITNNLGNDDSNVIGDGSDWSDSIGSGSDFNGGIGETYTVVINDFTVNVPNTITFVESEMEAWIRKYNSNNFNIVIV